MSMLWQYDNMDEGDKIAIKDEAEQPSDGKHEYTGRYAEEAEGGEMKIAVPNRSQALGGKSMVDDIVTQLRNGATVTEGTNTIHDQLLDDAADEIVRLRHRVKEQEMNDAVLGNLREARALLLEERDAGKNSRELSVALTEIDTAILWRQEDLRLKQPTVNEALETGLSPRQQDIAQALVHLSDIEAIMGQNGPSIQLRALIEQFDA